MWNESRKLFLKLLNKLMWNLSHTVIDNIHQFFFGKGDPWTPSGYSTKTNLKVYSRNSLSSNLRAIFMMRDSQRNGILKLKRSISQRDWSITFFFLTICKQKREEIPFNSILVTTDVLSLCTNFPTKEGIETVETALKIKLLSVISTFPYLILTK